MSIYPESQLIAFWGTSRTCSLCGAYIKWGPLGYDEPAQLHLAWHEIEPEVLP